MIDQELMVKAREEYMSLPTEEQTKMLNSLSEQYGQEWVDAFSNFIATGDFPKFSEATKTIAVMPEGVLHEPGMSFREGYERDPQDVLSSLQVQHAPVYEMVKKMGDEYQLSPPTEQDAMMQAIANSRGEEFSEAVRFALSNRDFCEYIAQESQIFYDTLAKNFAEAKDKHEALDTIRDFSENLSNSFMNYLSTGEPTNFSVLETVAYLTNLARSNFSENGELANAIDESLGKVEDTVESIAEGEEDQAREDATDAYNELAKAKQIIEDEDCDGDDCMDLSEIMDTNFDYYAQFAENKKKMSGKKKAALAALALAGAAGVAPGVAGVIRHGGFTGTGKGIMDNIKATAGRFGQGYKDVGTAVEKYMKNRASDMAERNEAKRMNARSDEFANSPWVEEKLEADRMDARSDQKIADYIRERELKKAIRLQGIRDRAQGLVDVPFDNMDKIENMSEHDFSDSRSKKRKALAALGLLGAAAVAPGAYGAIKYGHADALAKAAGAGSPNPGLLNNVKLGYKDVLGGARDLVSKGLVKAGNAVGGVHLNASESDETLAPREAEQANQILDAIIEKYRALQTPEGQEQMLAALSNILSPELVQYIKDRAEGANFAELTYYRGLIENFAEGMDDEQAYGGEGEVAPEQTTVADDGSNQEVGDVDRYDKLSHELLGEYEGNPMGPQLASTAPVATATLPEGVPVSSTESGVTMTENYGRNDVMEEMYGN